MASLLEADAVELVNAFGLGGKEKREVRGDPFSHCVEPPWCRKDG